MKRVPGECPLGSKCESIVDADTIAVCPWYVKMKGRDATGESHDEWNCAITWLPILQVEVAGTNRHVSSAVESLRNETVKRQDAAVEMLHTRKKKIIELNKNADNNTE